jgi:putative sugar O-methyltransferase
VVTKVASARAVRQVEDDLPLLHRMLADSRAAPAIYQPTHYWASYERPVIAELRAGLADFRGRSGNILSTFGATDPPPQMLTTVRVEGGRAPVVEQLISKLNDALAANEAALPDELRPTDVFDLGYSFCLQQAGRSPHIVSIDALEMSRVGNPYGYELSDGRFLTRSVLYYYMRYAYVAEHVDLSAIEVVVELGSGSGKQVEVLKKLHPHLTFVLCDLAPQLYIAERTLRAIFPNDVVSYDDTREGPLELQPGKLHFVGNHRIEDLTASGPTLFWSAASFGEMEPDVVAHYGKVVSTFADDVYLCQGFGGKEVAVGDSPGGVIEPVVWQHYVDAFSAYELVDRRAAHSGLKPLIQGRVAYDDTFWTGIDLYVPWTLAQVTFDCSARVRAPLRGGGR